jgi:hypothetical protein
LDYVINTSADPLRSRACVEQRYALIEKNRAALSAAKAPVAKHAGKKAAKPVKAKSAKAKAKKK